MTWKAMTLTLYSMTVRLVAALYMEKNNGTITRPAPSPYGALKA